jgi:hypothetical protein
MLLRQNLEFGAVCCPNNCKPKLASSAGIVDPSNAAALLCVLHIEGRKGLLCCAAAFWWLEAQLGHVT